MHTLISDLISKKKKKKEEEEEEKGKVEKSFPWFVLELASEGGPIPPSDPIEFPALT